MATGPGAEDSDRSAGPALARGRANPAQVEAQLESAVEALVERHPLQRASIAPDHVVSFREAGTGAPVVLLHGIGSSSASWVHQLDALAAHHRVIAWDAPGYGASTRLRADGPTSADYAAVLGRFVDHLGLQRFVLVGHSLGALIAGAFAARWDERLRGLVLASPAGGHARLATDVRRSRLDQRISQMRQLGPAGLARERGAALLSPQASPEAVALVRWNMARLDPTGYIQAAHMLAQGDLLGDLAALKEPAMPVQVMVGSADTVTPEAACRTIKEGCPGAQWQVLPGLGHALYIEAAGPVNETLANFSAGLPD